MVARGLRHIMQGKLFKSGGLVLNAVCCVALHPLKLVNFSRNVIKVQFRSDVIKFRNIEHLGRCEREGKNARRLATLFRGNVFSDRCLQRNLLNFSVCSGRLFYPSSRPMFVLPDTYLTRGIKIFRVAGPARKREHFVTLDRANTSVLLYLR